MPDRMTCTGRSRTAFNSEFGRFTLLAYEFGDGREHAALVVEPAAGHDAPLVRLQSACLTGTAFHALLCDCRQQLELALTYIAAEGGLVLYLDQEGRSHGLVEKVAQLAEISHGANTYEAARRRHVEPDVRDYAQAALIVAELLGDRPVRLLTNNPDKVRRATKCGIDVAERIALEPDPTPQNSEYLRVKKALMGHVLTKV